MRLNLFRFIKKMMTEKALVCAYGLMNTIVLIGYQSTANAAPIIIQNGRGLVGVANEVFSTSLMNITGYYDGFLPYAYVHMTFYDDMSNCGVEKNYLMEIDGVKGVKLNAEKTLMLVPEVIFTDNRSWNIGATSYADTIVGQMNGYGANTNENLGSEAGCMWYPLQSTPNTGFVTHKVSATGRLLIYGTGTQQSQTGYLGYPFKIMIRDPRSAGGYPSSNLIPAGGYSVVVSDLGCTLTTPTVIDFGPQSANATNGQLLTTKSDGNLTVNCQQNTNPMSATLSLSAGTNPIYFSGDDYQVNLINSENNAGAYVTMSLNINGTPTNIPFNRTPVDIGTIDASNSSATFSYPITYSLYSRGTGITGKVKGSAELSIVLR
ncbi:MULTISPECIES: fimbrial protein [Providencia]|uniref:fimbrial protein n=1 Tax=Providencia TaxID=586 RepID=UPI0010BEA766|nr:MULTISPECIES: fimbrial protein [Providencia]QIF65573.1 hypothetical protein FVA72_08620 [Providencia sp. 1709051003]